MKFLISFFIPFLFAVHGIIMATDEFWFHWKRNLPRWERWGHPIDTLSFIFCFALAIILPGSKENVYVYSFAALLSMLLITKDEWIHSRYCTAFEMWLHALLFLIHPILLAVAGIYLARFQLNLEIETLRFWIVLQTVISILFFFYQLIYWNGPWKRSLPTLLQK